MRDDVLDCIDDKKLMKPRNIVIVAVFIVKNFWEGRLSEVERERERELEYFFCE